MSTLDKKTIHYLTKLSRIHCSESEEDQLLTDLRKILNYVDQLNEIDTENVPPCTQVLKIEGNVMREDEEAITMTKEEFLENAPAHVGGLIRVPPILKQN